MTNRLLSSKFWSKQYEKTYVNLETYKDFFEYKVIGEM
jgi:hypothetical protein